MPIPVSAMLISMCEFTRSSSTWTFPSFCVNLMALESRFQTTCCSLPGSPEIGPAFGSRSFCTRMPFASAAGRTVSRAASMNDASATGWTSRRTWPEVMRDMSSRSSMSRVCARALRSITCTARRSSSTSMGRLPIHLRPAEDCAQGGAELVRKGRQELVLELAHPFRLGASRPLALEELHALLEKPRIVDRDGRLRGHPDDQPLGALGEDSGLGMAEEQAPGHASRGGDDRDGEIAAHGQVTFGQRPAAGILQQRHGAEAPHGAAVLAQVALLVGVLGDLAREQAAHVRMGLLQVFGVRDVGERHAGQLFSPVAENLGEPAVDFLETPVKIRHREPDRRLVKGCEAVAKRSARGARDAADGLGGYIDGHGRLLPSVSSLSCFASAKRALHAAPPSPRA